MLKAIIFDCDGVMFDSKEANRRYYNFLLEGFGQPAMSEADLEFVHIHNVYDSVRHIFAKAPQIDLAEVHAFRGRHSYLPFLKHMTMARDLLPFLETVYGRYQLAIATNRTDTMEPLLQEFGLEGYFAKVMTASNSPRPKPAADPLLEIVAAFDCRVAEAVYVGDSVVDEETARNCSMVFIAFQNQQLRAHFHIDSFTELLALLPKLDQNSGLQPLT